MTETSDNRSRSSATVDIVEATVAELHEAMEQGTLTAVELVTRYLDRIDAYDDQINSIIEINENATARADELDEQFAASGFVGPLHGIPLLIKDNFDTGDLPTTGGAKGFAGTIPPDDAFTVEKLREAGAIVIAKSNLPDFACGNDGASSITGQTRNPYNLEYIPGGSSSGTGAGVAANLAVAGMATETGCSIRNPATSNGVVAIAPTRGLVSRDGVIPISFTQDRAGPHARTVEDAARLLDVIVGYDPDDPQTATGIGHTAESYTDSLDTDGFAGARIGVIRELFDDESITKLVERAITDMERQDATVVDPVPIQEVLDQRLPVLDPEYSAEDTSLTGLLADARTNAYENERAMNEYLLTREDDFPYDSLQEILDAGGIRKPIADRFEHLPEDGIHDPEYTERRLRITALQSAVLQTMGQMGLDALVFPPKPNPAPRIDDDPGEPSRSGSENVLSSITGFPSVVVPSGVNETGVPEAIEFLGRPFTEERLLELAYSYEQASRHRSPPDGFGSLS